VAVNLKTENVGVTVSWQGCTISGLSAIASEADRLGYGCLWVPEAWGLEAFGAIAHVLDVTKRIRVGSGIVNVYSRSAALIAMACATFDQISPGRFMLGLGSSGRTLVEEWHGVRFERPLERSAEYVEEIGRIARGGGGLRRENTLAGNNSNNNNKKKKKPTSSFSSSSSSSGLHLYTKPLPPTGLEIYLGAIGDENLRLAGRICDGAIVIHYPISKLGRALGLLLLGGSQEGGEADEKKKKMLFAYLPAAVSNSQDELARARRSVAKNIGFYVASMGRYYARSLSRLGFAEEVSKIIEARSSFVNKTTTTTTAAAPLLLPSGRRASDVVADAVSDELVEELSLVGRPDFVSEKISKLPDGVTPVLGFSASTHEEVSLALNSLRLLANA
jgi:alkanesulfonate monooxygenase SsuD/methylene tetrahydromethanopterin reductase-like flavin-dependent oxidoreductase (luciferase family)